MSRQSAIPDLARCVAGLVKGIMTDLRPRLVEAALSGQRGEYENTRHEGNFLSVYDLWMHQQYKELLAKHIPSFIYASEEADPEVIGTDSDPEFCILVDPLDTSELAVRGLHGYTHVMVYSRLLARPVVSVVGDIFHYVQLYIGARDDHGVDRAYVVTADSVEHVLIPRVPRILSESLVTNYLMRPEERFIPLARQHAFMKALSVSSGDGKARGRIGVDFGSVGLCHVAAGFSDAMIEFAKGFAIWDLSPGHYILHASGGIVTDLLGAPIPLDYGLDSLADIASAMSRRQKFIAAADATLAREILGTLRV